MSRRVMKSDVGGAFPEQETFKETDFSSNFSALKPNRPENHKAEFKKKRESLTMMGDVDYQPEASSFQDLKPKRPTINRCSKASILRPHRYSNGAFTRIADKMITEGNYYHETESNSHTDLKPKRPIINRIADEMQPEGNFYHETESNALKDFKPKRPVINRIKDSM